MKKIIVFISLLLVFSFTGFDSNRENNDDFTIEIEESAMLRHSNFKISQDCIILEVWISPHEPKYYSKEVSKADKKAIILLLDKINFDALRKEYSNYYVDDMLEYDFKINYKGKTKEIHIYDFKVKPIFNLVAKINTLLPLEYRINYDDDYFSKR